MNYLKVSWKNENGAYPITIYSELSKDRFEIRKVEVFIDGSVHYAYEDGSTGNTMLGEAAIPSIENLAAEAEFDPLEISKDEFDQIWSQASNK